jgi:hypothetical protein
LIIDWMRCAWGSKMTKPKLNCSPMPHLLTEYAWHESQAWHRRRPDVGEALIL